MRVLLVGFIFATGCMGGGGRTLTPGTTATEPAIITKSCAGLPMDGFQLGESMTIDTEVKALRVSVSYGGGCEEHEFAACWDGSITKSSPSSLSLTLAHDAHDDLCDAFVTRDLFIDISKLPASFGAPTRAGANSIRLVELVPN